MGLFHKMTFAEAYRVLLADFPSKKDLKAAYKTVKGLKNPEYDFERYTVARAVIDLRDGKNIDSVFDCFTRLERENPDSPVMKQVRSSYGVHACFANAVFSENSVSARIWVATDYENGWSLDQNHESAVVFAEKLKDVTEASPYYALAKKTYEQIVTPPVAEEPPLEKFTVKEEPKRKKPKTEKKSGAEEKPQPKKEAPAAKSADKSSDKPAAERLEMKNGDVYEGGFLSGKYHGQGKYTSHKGWVYEAGFAYGEMSGECRVVFANGQTYEGGFLLGKRHGKGEERFPDGRHYVGEYNQDQYHGQGRFHYAGGDVYEGSWVGGVRQGQGIYKALLNSGDQYSCTEGWWEDGKRVGWHKHYLEKIDGGRVISWDDVYYVDGKRVERKDSPYLLHSTWKRFAKEQGSIFLEWETLTPDSFNEEEAIDFDGHRMDVENGVIKTESDLGVVYTHANLEEGVDYYHNVLLMTPDTVQEDREYVDYAKRPERKITKRRLYQEIEDVIYKKEMYVDGEGKALTYIYVFSLLNGELYLIDDCPYLSGEHWKFEFALEPEKGIVD